VDMDEFAAALDETASCSESSSSATDSAKEAVQNDNEDNLQHDVESNLKILAQLFPEVAKSTKKEMEEQSKSIATTAASGWGSTGQMLRFDPRNPQTAQQFVLSSRERANALVDETTDVKTTKCNNHDYESPSSTDNSSSSSTASWNASFLNEYRASASQGHESFAEANANIYEQAKLEQVFKQVQQSATANLAPVDDESAPKEPTGFSFGFDLKDNKPPDEPEHNGSFSFSFRLSDNIEVAKVAASEQESESNDSDAAIDDSASYPRQDLSPAPAPRRRRRAFEFPQSEDLDEYVHRFYYKLNDGERIINDLEGWRNDPAVKERWLKERSKLTADWKGKRKYALSKKKRRLR